MPPGLPQWLSGEESACNAGNVVLHAMVFGVAKSQTRLKQLGLHARILPSAIPKTTNAKVYRASEVLKGIRD